MDCKPLLWSLLNISSSAGSLYFIPLSKYYSEIKKNTIKLNFIGTWNSLRRAVGGAIITTEEFGNTNEI